MVVSHIPGAKLPGGPMALGRANAAETSKSPGGGGGPDAFELLV